MTTPFQPTKAQLNGFRKIVESRRSVRRFTDEAIPDDVVDDCLDMALVAPNSSNMQMWNFYRVVNPAKKKKMGEACLGQNAATTAAELIVCTGSTTNWKKHSAEMLDHWPEETVPKIVETYYKKAAYIHYGNIPADVFGHAKKFLRDVVGVVRPSPRWPNNQADMRVWAAKSVALACENMMLGFRAYGYDSCPMEGFDEARVKKICGIKRNEFVVMVIGAGRQHEKGIYHKQFRFARERFVHEIK